MCFAPMGRDKTLRPRCAELTGHTAGTNHPPCPEIGLRGGEDGVEVGASFGGLDKMHNA